MMLKLFLIAGGCWFMLLACIYANARAHRAYVTSRQVSDFAGDVQAWLRRETE